MKIPLALAKAADASFPTFVEEGKLVFRILRTHARGGSNSTADAGPFPLLAGVVVVVPAFSSTFVFSFVASAIGVEVLVGVILMMMIVNVW